MHGGTNPGAPVGNKNARRHGEHSAEAKTASRWVRFVASQIETEFDQRTTSDLAPAETNVWNGWKADINPPWPSTWESVDDENTTSAIRCLSVSRSNISASAG